SRPRHQSFDEEPPVVEIDETPVLHRRLVHQVGHGWTDVEPGHFLPHRVVAIPAGPTAHPAARHFAKAGDVLPNASTPLEHTSHMTHGGSVSGGVGFAYMRLGAGVRLGPYEVLAFIGAGGMAEVYRARDTRLGREVAVKVVSEALGADGAFVERFEREARLVGSVNHPNVIALYDVRGPDGEPDFAPELLQGARLRSP